VDECKPQPPSSHAAATIFSASSTLPHAARQSLTPSPKVSLTSSTFGVVAWAVRPARREDAASVRGYNMRKVVSSQDVDAANEYGHTRREESEGKAASVCGQTKTPWTL